jgi:hypothetical protein
MRLISAELLKLRRRRSLLVWAALLTIGSIVTIYSVLAVLHAADPAHHGPAGGARQFENGMYALSLFGGVAAVMVGAAAGAGDLQSGVFRDLVVTGRPRLQLYAARLPAVLAFTVPLALTAAGLAAAATTLFRDGLAGPGASAIVHGLAWAATVAVLNGMLGLGMSALVGSRSTVVGVLLAVQLALTPLLVQIDFLGWFREILPHAAADRLEPSNPWFPGQPLAVAMVVVVAWIAIALAAGAWRTATRDA